MKLLLKIVPIIILLISCQKQIEFTLPEVEQDIVIDGKIETGLPPMLILTTTQGYFDPTSADAVFGTFIHDAVVTVNDGVNEITLEEVCTNNVPDSLLGLVSQLTGVPEQNLQFIDYCVYTTFNPLAFGVEGRTYNLTVEKDTISITAKTSIPVSVPLANTWFEAIPNLDSLGFIWATLNDPSAEGDSYRWYAQRINQYAYNYPSPYNNVKGKMKDAFPIAPFGSVFDDKFFNGLSFDLQYNRGEVGNLEGPDDEGPEEGYFKRGDTVVVKFATIDHLNYLHLRALENQAATNGSPFASPGNLPTTIEGGIGLWIGYGVSLDTVICN